MHEIALSIVSFRDANALPRGSANLIIDSLGMYMDRLFLELLKFFLALLLTDELPMPSASIRLSVNILKHL